MDKIVNRLGEAIKRCNLSYAELEKRTNISKSALQRYASGKTKKIPLDVITSLAPVLDVTPQYLMGWDNNNKKDQNNNLSHIWKNLKQTRENKGMTKSELSKLTSIPIEQINDFENNINIPNYETLVTLSKVLDCEVSHLLLGDELDCYDMSIINQIDDIMMSDNEARKKLIKSAIDLPEEDILFIEKILDALNEKKAD
ncbi:helix-turn-helix domain-containing protein [Thomasclavelia cocleata]|uniref:helix-turn-helix domain-containing protein n=1 Tax=Thomasclavelia cocleata TaxID=69824 RepID=UPI00242F2BD3|nr:helix-turn-helix domain-containing protein [Thomasclavelia cocleata]